MLKTINIFGQTISSYALFICLGFLAAIFILLFEIKKYKLNLFHWDNFFCLLPVLIIGGFLGAALFDKIAHFNEKKLFEFAGLSFAGGLISALFLYLFFYPIIVSKSKKEMLEDINFLVCPFLIAHFFGRIGCFMAGCCYGKPTDSIIGVTFPEGSLQNIQYGYVTKVFPTQLFEAAFLFFLFLIFIFFKKVRNHKIDLYLILYGIFRFFIEFIRGDNRGAYFLLLSPSQWMSILFVILGTLLLLWKIKNDGDKIHQICCEKKTIVE